MRAIMAYTQGRQYSAVGEELGEMRVLGLGHSFFRTNTLQQYANTMFSIDPHY